MDTTELRRAFTLSETIFEKIGAFRRERVAQIVRDETPTPLVPGGRLILHVIPVSSFRSRQPFDVRKLKFSVPFPALTGPGDPGDSRLNLDGCLFLSSPRHERVNHSYCQFFRNGIVEAVLAEVVTDTTEGKLLHADIIEQILMNAFSRYLKGFVEIGVNPPLWGFLTITGVKGARIPTRSYSLDNFCLIDRDTLLLPEFIIEDMNADPSGFLRATFDLMWNASGFDRSPNFDKTDKSVSP